MIKIVNKLKLYNISILWIPFTDINILDTRDIRDLVHFFGMKYE